VEKFLIVPPPDELLTSRARADQGLEDPGMRERDDPGAQRAKDKEGKVGKRDATRDRTEVAGEPADAIAAQVRGMGLLGVLSGGGKNSLDDALKAPSLDNLLGGLGAAQTVLGRGSGGFGLRGSGSGGGGTATGALFGAGELGTQVAGGKGLGRGADGPGGRSRAPREAKLSLGGGDAKVSGYLSREQVDRVVRANQAAIKYCFESALQRAPKLNGAINVQWRIDRQGRVASARVAKSTLGDAGVEGCIVRQVKRWQFPTPDGGEVDVTYPFLFRGQ
jgi:TonB family protein